MNPRITQRDQASPLHWGAAQPGMSWHHILPYALLRDVWNCLVDRHIQSELPESRTAIRQYLALCDRNIPNLDSLVDRIRAENQEQRRASHHLLLPLDVAEAHMLATAAVWPPWNAVEGPQNRSDDPGDHYFDRFTFGLTIEEVARMNAIEGLFQDFQVYVASGNSRVLIQAISTARVTVACDMPIRFRPEMWVQEGRIWRKRREGDRILPGQR